MQQTQRYSHDSGFELRENVRQLFFDCITKRWLTVLRIHEIEPERSRAEGVNCFRVLAATAHHNIVYRVEPAAGIPVRQLVIAVRTSREHGNHGRSRRCQQQVRAR